MGRHRIHDWARKRDTGGRSERMWNVRRRSEGAYLRRGTRCILVSSRSTTIVWQKQERRASDGVFDGSVLDPALSEGIGCNTAVSFPFLLVLPLDLAFLPFLPVGTFGCSGPGVSPGPADTSDIAQLMLWKE